MTRYIRRVALCCLLPLLALLVNAGRLQLVEAGSLEANSANRRAGIERYQQPRGEILVAGRGITGSKDTGENLRYERTYREGPLYAPVTGFDSQTYGSSLLENAEDAVLSGTDPALAPFGSLAALAGADPGRSPGGRVFTTLDPAAQRAAFEGLGDRKGAVAALDPSTGRILALVSTPSYDPGALSGTSASVGRRWKRLEADPDQPMLNRAVRGTYPPGSTFKVVTAAAALDAGLVRDLDAPTRSPDPYRLPGSDRLLGNEARGCRNASLRYAFAWSCNTVFARLGVRTGLPAMSRTAGRFGFDDASLRIPFPVAPSTFDTGMDRAQLAMSAIGQFDTRATPLQMAMVAGAVAAGGAVKPPYLVDKVTTGEGRTVRRTAGARARQAMTPATARLLAELMTTAVEEGSGKKARIPGATVGGKTGTAQHGVANSGTPYAWFVSWAQSEAGDAPPVAVAVVVEDAAADRAEISGGGSAAPIARAVMEAALGR
ncbi:penicillin-binding protein [Streptomyces albus]|uniref:Penicillin-binding protein n=1 Tax=Streptomyces albus (strain ATCC 21838 / DSM 41398 / FERM P-419 / JCM 4703 / NBRC 107858) TaxID=1081613 RepID=A0A0B5ELH7_STRA4|nr:penicillin-binding protein [Streptomyces albus]AOU76679.1 penicillin-binding protein [Streptomyces albus]AYN32459.1 penicillin-binding protein [Streptomyces albus]